MRVDSAVVKARLRAKTTLIGSNLRKIRCAKGLTQSDLGNAVGLSYQQIQRYESGGCHISVPRALQLVEVLGCSLNRLLNGTRKQGEDA